ncbi:MAG: (E)-4-hydroxy-3-methylbut-2-enyl-diphosphate synthase [Bacteroidetes bacterium]|nr:(E)-4-hydroxy-3-methylbut-2-enyl-diphosphate synthase [Bacteroidota bacterium]
MHKESAPARIRQYVDSLVNPRRLKTREVKVGGMGIGGSHPIRVQSMTTTDTLDTAGSVAQCIRMIEAGCQLLRLTAPSLKEAENLRVIREELRRRSYTTPLVADIHFTPNAAELAARIVEKVRINPGNYADKKKFATLSYTDTEYQAELERIYKRFAPLVRICKEYGTAMRIGTNHGSLSDRIMSRYGDTPEGMVQSALEFLDICEDLNYHDIVISMKASNPQVMVQAYRLLAQRMQERDYVYPLHVGVTEAGDGEDGRIKSALGMGTLLADGIGDTVRVSLTEEPEAEMPVGRYLVRHFERYMDQADPHLEEVPSPINPYAYTRRPSKAVYNIGGDHVPRVIADLSQAPLREQDLLAVGHYYSLQLDKWNMTDMGADYLYLGSHPSPFMLPNGLRAIYDAAVWHNLPDTTGAYPYYVSLAEWQAANLLPHQPAFVRLTLTDTGHSLLSAAAQAPVILVLEADDSPIRIHAWRNLFFHLMQAGITCPVIVHTHLHPLRDNDPHTPEARLQTELGCLLGPLLTDGLGDGFWLSADPALYSRECVNRSLFTALQMARARITKTEYISCPSCGRTLFDLQETTARIRARTEHLKGVKIGIMGCIVNGPGEMADADYGYVGSGPGQITLYRGQEVVQQKVPAEQAVDALIALIAGDGRWVESARETS